MACLRCRSKRPRRAGPTQRGGHRWRCNGCGRRFAQRAPARSRRAFSHDAVPDDLIVLAVRWYVRSRLSYAEVVAWLAARGGVVDRSTG
jgi:transposase-like protein